MESVRPSALRIHGGDRIEDVGSIIVGTKEKTKVSGDPTTPGGDHFSCLQGARLSRLHSMTLTYGDGMGWPAIASPQLKFFVGGCRTIKGPQWMNPVSQLDNSDH